MRLIRDLTSALAAVLLSAATAAAQTAATPAEGTASFTIFAGTTPIGTEEMTVVKIADGWRVSATGSQRAPAALVINSFDMTLAADWHPRELKIDALLRDQPISSITTFNVTTAVTDYMQNGRKSSVTHQISPRTIALPNAFYAAYEVLAARLGPLNVGAPLKLFVVPQAEIDAVVRSISEQKVVTTTATIALRRYELGIENAGGEVRITVDVDARNRLARVVIPGAQITVVRDDLSSVSSRTVTYRNPGDEDVFVPALGFNLAATITKPAGAPAKAPAIVLVGGSGPTDRDETVSGVSLFGQLAGELAKAGFLVLRYDKRGLGQSGGRPEAATLSDYADDARAAVTYLSKRKDVDKDRIALVGHSEGAAMALITASREKKVKAVVLLNGPGTSGYDLILEQQRQVLSEMKLTQAERDARIAMQQRIMDAALKGAGWEGISPQVRATADTPWFRSFLTFNPADVMKNVKQPLLIVRGERDTQVPAHHADKLAVLANARKKLAPSQIVTITGASHLLAADGVKIAPEAPQAIAAFLKQALGLR